MHVLSKDLHKALLAASELPFTGKGGGETKAPYLGRVLIWTTPYF